MELAALSDSQIGLLIVLRSERKSRKVGTQKWSSATAKTLATITTGLKPRGSEATLLQLSLGSDNNISLGLMITSVGELKFELLLVLTGGWYQVYRGATHHEAGSERRIPKDVHNPARSQ